MKTSDDLGAGAAQQTTDLTVVHLQSLEIMSETTQQSHHHSQSKHQSVKKAEGNQVDSIHESDFESDDKEIESSSKPDIEAKDEEMGIYIGNEFKSVVKMTTSSMLTMYTCQSDANHTLLQSLADDANSASSCFCVGDLMQIVYIEVLSVPLPLPHHPHNIRGTSIKATPPPTPPSQ